MIFAESNLYRIFFAIFYFSSTPPIFFSRSIDDASCIRMSFRGHDTSLPTGSVSAFGSHRNHRREKQMSSTQDDGKYSAPQQAIVLQRNSQVPIQNLQQATAPTSYQQPSAPPPPYPNQQYQAHPQPIHEPASVGSVNVTASVQDARYSRPEEVQGVPVHLHKPVVQYREQNLQQRLENYQGTYPEPVVLEGQVIPEKVTYI